MPPPEPVDDLIQELLQSVEYESLITTRREYGHVIDRHVENCARLSRYVGKIDEGELKAQYSALRNLCGNFPRLRGNPIYPDLKCSAIEVRSD